MNATGSVLPRAGLSRAPWTEWWPVVALIAVWLPLVLRLGRVWSVVPGQAFGWTVPLLATALAWERWQTRPRTPGEPETAGEGSRIGTRARTGAWVLVVLGLVLLAASSPVLEANASWPTVQWVGLLAAAAVTLGGVALLYGWATARHLIFPIAFLSTALTWPTAVNTRVVAGLVGINATLAAEVVSALGWPAVVAGNVIAVSTGWVGIDEACSGLRSLQATWMLAWFLGEFFGFGWSRRGMLVACALVVAIVGNLVRTTFLTWQAAAHGLAAGERWHDPAGTAELVGTLAGVVFVAVWIARRRRDPATAVAMAGPVARQAGRRNEADDARSPASVSPPARRIGRRLAVGLLVSAVMIEAGTQAWYRWHELRPMAARVRWELVPMEGWVTVPMSAGVAEVLRYDEAQGFADAAGSLAYRVSWSGLTAHGENAEWHDPTVCVPAAGATLERDIGLAELNLGNVQVPFAGYRFNAGGKPFQVFFCQWDAEVNTGRAALDFFNVRALRLLRVWEGRRRGNVTHLIFVVQRNDDAEAWAWLRAAAPQLLHPVPASPVGPVSLRNAPAQKPERSGRARRASSMNPRRRADGRSAGHTADSRPRRGSAERFRIPGPPRLHPSRRLGRSATPSTR